jgi:hypothetical protein
MDDDIIWDEEIVWDSTPEEAPAPVVTPPAAIPEKQPGFLPRSMERLQLGLSDAMSTIAGETYGRAGDPTQQDDLGVAGRALKIAGGDVIPAVGDVGWDAVSSAAQTVFPETSANIEQKFGDFAGAVASSETGQKLGALKERLDRQYPEQQATAGELLNVGAAMLPKAKPKWKGQGGQRRLDNALQAERTKKTKNMLIPEQNAAQGDWIEKKGGFKNQSYDPSPIEARQFKAAEDLPGFDPNESFNFNAAVVEKEITNLKSKLDEGLKDAPPIPANKIDDALQDAIARADESPTMVGDAEQSAQKIYKKFNALLADTIGDTSKDIAEISAVDLMDVRRDLDSWLKKNGSSFFDPSKSGASQIATREIRTTINDLVSEIAPDVEVKELLQKQFDLLSANSTLRQRGWGEGKNRLSRFFGNLEKNTGFRHPTTPLGQYQTARNLPVAVASGVGLLGARALQKGGQRTKMNSAAAQKALASALRGGAEATQTGALLELMKDEEE